MSVIVLPNGCPRCGRPDAKGDGVLVYCVRCGIYDCVNAGRGSGFLQHAIEKVLGR